jgi:hypothetical protein
MSIVYIQQVAQPRLLASITWIALPFILLGTHKELYETEVFKVQIKFKK